MLLGVASSALATTDWSYTTTNRDWFNPANWDDSGAVQPVPQPIPTAATEVRTHASYGAPYAYTAIIAAGSPYNPSELPAVASVINIGGNANSYVTPQFPRGQLTINSGTLTVGNGIRVGGSSSSIRSGEFYVNGGVVNSPVYLAVGYGPGGGGNSGWMYMTDGIVNVGQFDIVRIAGTTTGINGYAYISGGTINATDLRMKPAGGTGTALLDITGSGKIVITGDKVATIQGYIDNGWIKTNGVAWEDYSLVSYDAGTNKTTLIPEPATICLLGIGALSLLRRRK